MRLIQVLASHPDGHDELGTIAAAASLFLERAEKANHRLLQGQLDDRSSANHRLLQNQFDGSRGSSGSSDAGSRVAQKWVRQRIDVKTDEWHRVRALPMYCSSSSSSSSSGRVSSVRLKPKKASEGQQELF